MPDGCQTDEVFKLPGKRLKASRLQHCKCELVIAKCLSPVFMSVLCYETAGKIAIALQVFSCLSGNSSEFHVLIETCSDTV